MKDNQATVKEVGSVTRLGPIITAHLKQVRGNGGDSPRPTWRLKAIIDSV